MWDLYLSVNLRSATVLTVYLVGEQLSVDHPVRVEEDTAHQEPGRLLVWEVDGLTHDTEAHHHDQQDDQEVTHVT